MYTDDGYIKIVGNNTVNKLIDLTDNVKVFEGKMQFNYIFWDTQHIKFDKIKSSKYIIIEEKSEDCPSDGLKMTMTDDMEIVEMYYNKWELEKNREDDKNV